MPASALRIFHHLDRMYINYELFESYVVSLPSNNLKIFTVEF